MKRVFYFNINYICNNKCLFCFSHSTNIDLNIDLTIESALNIISEYKINFKDRVIINGGEPTLHKDLLKLLKIFKNIGCETVFYSNGIKFENKDYLESVLKTGLDRITIPIHGDIDLHSYITQNPESYKSTILGLKNMIFFKPQFDTQLEVKFIITSHMFESGFDIVAFLKSENLKDIIDCIVLTQQVNTKVAIKNNFINQETDAYMEYVTNQIKNIYEENLTMKLEDVSFCTLGKDTQKLIRDLPEKPAENFENFYFFDGYNKKMELREYSSLRKEKRCKNCENRMICRSILDSYQILMIANNHKQIVLE